MSIFIWLSVELLLSLITVMILVHFDFRTSESLRFTVAVGSSTRRGVKLDQISNSRITAREFRRYAESLASAAGGKAARLLTVWQVISTL